MNAELNHLLRANSRSFYLTLRALPTAVRPQIGLAYLLARTTDTIADTELVPLTQRLAALQSLRARILGTSDAPLDFGELARSQAAPAERALLENSETALAALRELSPSDLLLTRAALDTITSGQDLDLRRFQCEGKPTLALTPALSPRETENVADALTNPTPSDLSLRGNEKLPHLGERAGVRAEQSSKIIALQNNAELDDYTYRVAGCVGEFWTKMCRTHLFPKAKLDDALLMANGIRFGKGLQLVNILRDLPRDLRTGRCYIPQDELSAAGLTSNDLLAVSNKEKFLPVYEKFLDVAAQHLAAGWEYTKSLPRNQFRVRLACAWPILIGARTIQKLRGENILDASRRVKVSRAEIRNLMAKSILLYPFPSRWNSQFTKAFVFRNAVDSHSSFYY